MGLAAVWGVRLHRASLYKAHRRFEKGLATMDVPLVESPCLLRKCVPD